MLTFEPISATCPSDCGGLAIYMAEQALPHEVAQSVSYYETGTRLSPGEPAVSDERIRLAAQVVARDAMPEGEAFEALATNVVGDRMRTQAPEPNGEGICRIIPTHAWMVAAGLQDRDEALEQLVEADRLHAAPVIWDWRSAEQRLEPQLVDAIDCADQREQAARDTATTSLRSEFDSALRWERAKLNGDVVLSAQVRHDIHPLAAAGLGIDTSRLLTRDEVSALLSGRRADGTKIPGKRYATEHTFTDANTGKTKESVPIGSYDFCFAPHKSVSVAWAFAAPAERAMLYAAHRQAAHAAMEAVNDAVGHARLGAGGRGGREPGHVAWIAFDHYTARPTLHVAARGRDGLSTTSAVVPVTGDPQLHTHFLMINAVFCESGRVGSLDTAGIRGVVKELGALYQAHLAAQLREVGADVTIDERTGAAKLTAVPDHVSESFSKKTNGGDHAAREYARDVLGVDWDELTPQGRARLLHEAVQGKILVADNPDLNKRLAKDGAVAFDEWNRQAAGIGYDHSSVLTGRNTRPDLPEEARIVAAYDAALPWLEAEFNGRAVLSASEVRTAATRGLIATGGTLDSDDVARVTQAFWDRGVRQHGEMTSLVYGREEVDGHEVMRVTTALHESDEREFMALAKAAAGDRRDALPRTQIDQAVRASGLTFDDAHGQAQLDAIHRLGEGGRLGAFVATAGAGKTSALTPLVSAWKAEGRDVYGIALAWRHADTLVDAGISENARIKGQKTAAISAFLRRVDDGRIKLSPRSVVVVDEISMVGTRQGVSLLRLQAQHGFRMVMLGDEKQAQAVEAGNVVGLMRRALGDAGLPEIETTRRQKSEREKQIVGLFRQGRAAEALTMKRDDGTVQLVPGDYRECVERTAAYVGSRLRAGADITVSTATNRDVRFLGLAIREQRRQLGMIGADEVTVRAVDRDGEYQMRLAAGDKVRLFDRMGAEGRSGVFVTNGSIATVVSANTRGVLLRNAKGSEGHISWNRISDEKGRIRLAYGDAMTVDAAQSSTVSEHVSAFPGGSAAVRGTKAFSSFTRHEHTHMLFLSEGSEMAAVDASRPRLDRRPITPNDLWASVAAHFNRQQPKELATDFLARSRDVCRASAAGLRHTAHLSEMREARGQPETTLRAAMQQRREARAAEAAQTMSLWTDVAAADRVVQIAQKHQRQEQHQQRQAEHRQTRGMGLSM